MDFPWFPWSAVILAPSNPPMKDPSPGTTSWTSIHGARSGSLQEGLRIRFSVGHLDQTLALARCRNAGSRPTRPLRFRLGMPMSLALWLVSIGCFMMLSIWQQASCSQDCSQKSWVVQRFWVVQSPSSQRLPWKLFLYRYVPQHRHQRVMVMMLALNLNLNTVSLNCRVFV